jgi:formylglycine-generating enzyme required for sulfatase activity
LRLLGSVAALCLIVIGAAAAWIVFSPRRPPRAKETPAQASGPWVPAGFERAVGAEARDVSGRQLASAIVKKVNGYPVVFQLIPHEARSDPPTFYMMRDKVSNALFRMAVGRPEFEQPLHEYEAQNPGAVRQQWEKGGIANGKDDISPDGRRPVLRVTPVEAYYFARWFDPQANLPTCQQWEKAFGCYNRPDNPFGPGFVRDKVADHHTHALSVDRLECGDITFFGCRDMAGNGQEWTADAGDVGTTGRVPFPSPHRNSMVKVCGRSYSHLKSANEDGPLKCASEHGVERFFSASATIGFRIVLDIPPSRE